jgi:hypothetical protein
MAAQQLNLLDPRVDAPAARRARQRTAQTAVPVSVERALAAGEALVEHRYPAALDFLREHGPDAVAVLHLLAVDAEAVDRLLVASVSTRAIAARLGFLSKDSAHRRLRQLRRAGVIEVLASTGPTDPPSYVLHLGGTGITVTLPDASR